MAKLENTLKNKMEIIMCPHCNKKITQPALIGLTLVCPYCKKSVNGQYYYHNHDFKKITEKVK